MTAEEAAMIMMCGGGGSGGSIEPLTVTENGIYIASGDVDGYSPIKVAIGAEDNADYSGISGNTLGEYVCNLCEAHTPFITGTMFDNYKFKAWDLPPNEAGGMINCVQDATQDNDYIYYALRRYKSVMVGMYKENTLLYIYENTGIPTELTSFRQAIETGTIELYATERYTRKSETPVATVYWQGTGYCWVELGYRYTDKLDVYPLSQSKTSTYIRGGVGYLGQSLGNWHYTRFTDDEVVTQAAQLEEDIATYTASM